MIRHSKGIDAVTQRTIAARILTAGVGLGAVAGFLFWGRSTGQGARRAGGLAIARRRKLPRAPRPGRW